LPFTFQKASKNAMKAIIKALFAYKKSNGLHKTTLPAGIFHI